MFKEFLISTNDKILVEASPMIQSGELECWKQILRSKIRFFGMVKTS